jgi:DNA mismatch repair protein MutL
MPIRILDEALANQIAAGEVIERPASVVKELVENAIDAGATEVTVDIEEAGRKLIRVTDNGSGMAADDAVLSLQRHATSKIATTEDLFSIRTLGFRGEALPSIAAVSHLRLTTRLHDAESGSELDVRGGTITDLRDVGCPPGTRLEVRQLFFNTPARLKFLKSDTTEFGHIADLLNALSLCHHTVGFRLTHNGREVLARPPAARLEAHLGAWLGRETAEATVPVDLALPGIHVAGAVGKPEASRGNRGGQLIFLNGRRITSRMLTHALEVAFAGLLGPGRYPVGVLTLTLDPEQVDVNVHPAKAEVRFHREADAHAAVVRAVKQALADTTMVQEIAVWAGSGGRPVSRPMSLTAPPQQGNLGLSPAEARLTGAPGEFPAAAHALHPQDDMRNAEPGTRNGLRAIGQLQNIFLLAEGRDGLLIINQHRAHERVLFDRLLRTSGHADAQRLVLPSTVHLGAREAALFDAQLDDLAGYGFEVEPLSGGSYLVRAVPAALGGADPDTVLREVLADLEAGVSIAPFSEEDPARRAVEERRRRLAAAVACKTAIKAGKPLTPREQEHLLAGLEASSQPSLCPHGGPIIMTVTRYELDHKFGR